MAETVETTSDQQQPGDDAATKADVPAGHREITTKSVIEAILFASDEPLSAGKLAQIAGVGDARDARKHVAALNEGYERAASSFRIEEIAGGYQMLTLPEYNTWLTALHHKRGETRLTQAALETLALVAYKQPVRRVDVETVRGVAVGEVLGRLREIGLVKIVGRAEELGRPLLYGTTKKFLEVFGLASLKDLPQAEELPAPPEESSPRPVEPVPEPPDVDNEADLPDENLIEE